MPELIPVAVPPPVPVPEKSPRVKLHLLILRLDDLSALGFATATPRQRGQRTYGRRFRNQGNKEETKYFDGHFFT
jgi:hypothetical protein